MRPLNRVAGHILLAVGHIAGIASLAMGVALFVLPYQYVKGVTGLMFDVPRLWEMSYLSVALHFGLAACLWALLVIVYKLVRLRAIERKGKPATVKLSRGSVMTETLIVMPILLLLTFGMGQLAVNNITGVLANVAAYEAARAAWVWQPEEDASDRRMGISDGIAAEKCKIAVAMVMLPTAPGDYVSNVALSGYAEKARIVALGANVPLQGVLASIVPSEALTIFEGGVTLASLSLRVQKGSYADALDGSSFWQRTIRKFTAAYHGAECTIGGDHSVTMTYNHYVAMPGVDRIFGSFKVVGLRPGWYSEYTRNFGFRKQANTPNNTLPVNEWLNPPSYDDNEFDPEAECTGDCP